MHQSKPAPFKTPRPAAYALILCLLYLTIPAAIAQIGTSSPALTNPSSTANAADLYKQAMDLDSHLTDEEENIFTGKEQPDVEARAAVYAEIQPIMDLMRKARRASYVDWGLPPPSMNDSVSGAILLKVQALAKLARWDAGYRFSTDPDGAIADVAAMEAMGRRVALSMIGLMVRDGIHSMGIRLIAQNASHISNGVSPDLSFIINPAGIAQAFQNAINGEALLLKRELERYANPATRDESFIQKLAVKSSITPAEMASEFKWLAETEQAFSTTLEQPDAQFQQWWTGKLAEAAAMPPSKLSVDQFANMRDMTRAVLVEDAMLTAGIALEQHDQTRFQSTLDPTSGKPFTCTQTATGFQLTSAQTFRNKPVTLDFPAPAPK